MTTFKEIAFVDIDGCLIQDGILNLALVERLKVLKRQGHSICLFTQRNAGVLLKKAREDLRLQTAGRSGNPLATTAGILAALAELGLTDVDVSTSTDHFFGAPYRYYPEVIAAFEQELQQAFETALCTHVSIDSLLSAEAKAVIANESQLIETWLASGSEDSRQEQEKLTYLRDVIRSYIKSHLRRQAQTPLLNALAKINTKKDLLAIAHKIAEKGLVVSGDDLLSDGAEREVADPTIFLPIDKVPQMRFLAQHILAQAPTGVVLKGVLFDDNDLNEREIDTFYQQNPNPCFHLRHEVVVGQSHIPLEHYPLSYQTEGPTFRADIKKRNALISQLVDPAGLTDESVREALTAIDQLAASENPLDKIGAQQCYSLIKDHQHIAALKWALADNAQRMTSADADVSSACRLQETALKERIAAITGIKTGYDAASGILYTETRASTLQILATGCTGKEAKLHEKLWHLRKEWNAREKVATGMYHQACSNATRPEEVASFTVLLGDQVYSLPADINKDVKKPYDKLNNVRGIIGNHEIDCEGSGTSLANALALRDAYVQAIGQDSSVIMPAPYYAEIIRHSDTQEIRAFILYVDSNLLPVEQESQQAWLKKTAALFDELDPLKKVPRFLMAHHSVMESVDKRGMQREKGTKYSDPSWKTGNHHQAFYHAIVQSGITISDYLVVAAHIHDTSISLRGPLQDASNEPLGQFMLGAGGSYSNKDNIHTLNRGTEVIESGFGYGEFEIDAGGQVQFHYYNCDDIDLSDTNVFTQKPTLRCAISMDYPEKTVVAQTGCSLSKIILQRLAKTLDFLMHVVTNKAPYRLTFHLLEPLTSALVAYQKDQKKHGIAMTLPTCFDDLKKTLSLTDVISVDTLDKLQVAIEACLRTIIKPCGYFADGQPYHLPPTKLDRLLQTYQCFLTKWQLALKKHPNNDSACLAELQQFFIEPREMPSLSEESDFIFRHTNLLADLEEDETPTLTQQQHSTLATPDQLYSGDTINPLHSAMVNTAPTQPSRSPNKTINSLCRHGASISPELKQRLLEWCQACLNDETLLRRVFAKACLAWPKHFMAAHDGRVNGKPCSKILLPFIAMKDKELALSYLVHCLTIQAHPSKAIFHSLLAGVSEENPAVDFRAKVLYFAAIEINALLNKKMQSGDFNATLLVDALRHKKSELYLKKGPVHEQGCQHEAMVEIIIDELHHHHKTLKDCREFLKPEFLSQLWADDFWQRQLLSTLAPDTHPQLLQLCHRLWTLEKSWQMTDIFPSFMLAHKNPLAKDVNKGFHVLTTCVMASATEEAFHQDFSIKMSGTLITPELTTYLELLQSPDYFSQCKALLIRAKKEGWLNGLPEAVEFLPENARETIAWRHEASGNPSMTYSTMH